MLREGKRDQELLDARGKVWPKLKKGERRRGNDLPIKDD